MLSTALIFISDMMELILNDPIYTPVFIVILLLIAFSLLDHIFYVRYRIMLALQRKNEKIMQEATKYVYQQKYLLHKSINLDELYKEKKAIDSFTPEARRLPVIRRPNFQARRLRNNRAGFYNRLHQKSNLIRDELHLLNEQGCERRS